MTGRVLADTGRLTWILTRILNRVNYGAQRRSDPRRLAADVAAFLAAVGRDPDAEVLRVKNRFDPGYVIAYRAVCCTALSASSCWRAAALPALQRQDAATGAWAGAVVALAAFVVLSLGGAWPSLHPPCLASRRLRWLQHSACPQPESGIPAITWMQQCTCMPRHRGKRERTLSLLRLLLNGQGSTGRLTKYMSGKGLD